MTRTLAKSANNKKSLKKATEAPLMSAQGLKFFKVILLVMLAVAIFYPPFLRGLYFEDEQLPTEIIVFMIFAAFWVYKALKRDKRFLETPLDYASLAFTAVYLVSVLVAVTTRGALNEWLKYCMYFAVFFMLSELTNTYRLRLAVIWTIIASALGMSLLGIDGAAGAKIAAGLNAFFKNANVLDKFFLIFGEDREVLFGLFVGGRINSTLQYPNALAAYLLAVFFVTLGVMTASKSIWSKLISGATSYILLITFILTMSRGVYLLLPVAAILYVLLLPKEKRVRGLSYAFASLAGVSATVIQLSEFMTNNKGNESNIWKYILIGTVISIVASLLIHFIAGWLEKLNWKVYAILGAVLVIAGIAGVITAITAKEPLELSHTGNQPDSAISVRRSFYVEPEKEYKLVFEVEATGSTETKSAYNIAVASRNFAGTISGIDTSLTILEGKATGGKEQKEIQFKAPSDARTVSVTFTNQFQGTSTVFHSAKIIPIGNEEREQNIILKYKFIPESFYSRIDDAKETKSAIERTIFYKDGFKAISDNGHWVLGAGGGAWPLLYFGYQSYLYWTTQAHTYLVQIALECGILGFAVLLLLIAALISSLAFELRRRKSGDIENSIVQVALFTSITVMLMHSFMDFDLSLSAVFLLLWELIALFNSSIKSSYELTDENGGNSQSSWNKFLSKVDLGKRLHKQQAYPALVIIATLIVIALPISFLSAKINATNANKYYSAGDITNALSYMSRAADTDGFAYEYKVDYANLILKQEQKNIKQKDLTKASKYISQSENAAENSVDLSLKAAAFYFGTGNLEKGLHFIERATELRPMRPEEWYQKADAYMQVALFYLQQGNTKKAEEFFEKIKAITDEVKDVNKRNMIPFVLNPATQEIIERVKFLVDNVNGDKEVDLSKLVFYPVNDMDVNSDRTPDQWSVSNAGGVKLSNANGNITAESAVGKTDYIQSRPLSLQAGKTYKIEVVLAGAQGLTNMPFMVSGVSDKNSGLQLSDGVYSAYVTTSAQYKKDNNVLLLGINGKYEIKSVKIMEQ